MTFYTLAITKTIVVTVEAEDYAAAQEDVSADYYLGDYDRALESTPPHFAMVGEE